MNRRRLAKAGFGHDSARTDDSCGPPMQDLSPEALRQVASYFQALSEPTRLQILNMLREGEQNVRDLAQACGFTSANISRHLSVLMQHGLVERDARGTSVYYRIADTSVYALCDLVCGSIAERLGRLASERSSFLGGAQAAGPAQTASGRGGRGR